MSPEELEFYLHPISTNTMRYAEIAAELFVTNRERLRKLLLPNSLAVLNANDVLPTNADGTLSMVANADLFYLSGVEQEQTILMLYPDADDEKQRELLFLREPSAENELWEGHKLTKEEARTQTGIQNVYWLSEFPRLFHRLMCECEHVYLNSNEHKRAVIEVESREARFVASEAISAPRLPAASPVDASTARGKIGDGTGTHSQGNCDHGGWFSPGPPIHQAGRE